MSLWVRQTAWLNATPERAHNDKSTKPLQSRMEILRAQHRDESYEPEMPPLTAEYLIGYLYEIGPVVVAGMGMGPITHVDIKAWMDTIGIELQPWEVRFLKQLSLEYLSESHRAEKANCPPPWKSENLGARVASAGLRDSLRNLTKL